MEYNVAARSHLDIPLFFSSSSLFLFLSCLVLESLGTDSFLFPLQRVVEVFNHHEVPAETNFMNVESFHNFIGDLTLLSYTLSLLFSTSLNSTSFEHKAPPAHVLTRFSRDHSVD
jgi:hypothetical protein